MNMSRQGLVVIIVILLIVIGILFYRSGLFTKVVVVQTNPTPSPTSIHEATPTTEPTAITTTGPTHEATPTLKPTTTAPTTTY